MKNFEKVCGCCAPGRSLDSLQNFSQIQFVWRKAFETIRDEIGRLHNTQRPISILEIVAFIDAELQTEVENGESK